MIAGWWWLLPWDFSPTVLGFALLAASWYLRSGAAAALWRRRCFWTGFLILYGALQSGLDYYADHAFFVHRIQHLLLHHLGPFLVALGLPPLKARAWSRYPWLSTALFAGNDKFEILRRASRFQDTHHRDWISRRNQSAEQQTIQQGQIGTQQRQHQPHTAPHGYCRQDSTYNGQRADLPFMAVERSQLDVHGAGKEQKGQHGLH